jgi:hypothetical protein
MLHIGGVVLAYPALLITGKGISTQVRVRVVKLILDLFALLRCCLYRDAASEKACHP